MYRSEEGHLIIEYDDCNGHYDEYAKLLHNQMEYFGRLPETAPDYPEDHRHDEVDEEPSENNKAFANYGLG